MAFLLIYFSIRIAFSLKYLNYYEKYLFFSSFVNIFVSLIFLEIRYSSESSYCFLGWGESGTVFLNLAGTSFFNEGKLLCSSYTGSS